MIKKLPLLLLILGFSRLYAETIKTDVLVIGGSASGVSAAVQSARSKVKTMLIEPGPWLGGSMTAGGMCILDADRNLPSGIWGEYRRKVRDFYKRTPGYDTTVNAVLKFEPFTGAAILKKLTDTVKNLTIKLNTPWSLVKKDGTGWEITVTIAGKPVTIKAKVLVDATEMGDVAEKAGATFVTGFESRAESGEEIAPVKPSPLIEDVTWVAILKDYGRAADHTMPRPENYNPALYACLKGKDIKKMLDGGKLPNDKYMIKWGECANTYGATVADLSPEHREAYYKDLRLRTLGLVYYLQTELGFKNLAIDPQEFSTPDHLPYMPYVREYRRVKGQIKMMLDDVYKPYERQSKLYRTSIAVGDATPGQHYSDEHAPKTDYPPFPAYTIPLGSVIVRDFDNLLVTGTAISVTHLVNASSFYPSVQMVLGQGVGTVAAYCAFYHTTTKNLGTDLKAVRSIQTELLDFKAWLMPFADIPQSDKYFRAIQQVGASGLIRGIQKTTGKTAEIFFMPDSAVNTSEIKPLLTEIYTRAFLWFNKNKPGEKFTVGNLLSFIGENNLSEPETLRLNMQKNWKTVYKFKTDFNVNRPVTRYEFAVLANAFFNPFARHVDLTGRLIN